MCCNVHSILNCAILLALYASFIQGSVREIAYIRMIGNYDRNLSSLRNNTTQATCAALCTQRVDCKSYLYNPISRQCKHSSVILSKGSSSGTEWVYMIRDEKALVNTGTNLAQAKTTNQSSTKDNLGPEKAVDGLALNVNGTCISQTHTACNDNSPWWMVDLGNSYNIEHVIFLGKTTEMVNRLHDITISVGETSTDMNRICGFYEGPPQQREWVIVDCLASTKGRFVKLAKPFSPQESFLELCEVIVKGV